MALPGWGTVAGKIAEWLPGKKEYKESQITKLRNENAQLAKEEPLSTKSANRIQSNVDTIKRLRQELERIS